MKGIIKKFKSTTYEKRLITFAMITTAGSSLMAVGKILLGAFSDPILCAVGVFNILLVIAKASCIVGERKQKPFGKRNTFTAVFLFSAGFVYSLYMAAELLFDIPQKEYTMFVSIALAAVAFAEMGVAIYGLIRTRRRGHYYRNIKIISFVSALVAIITAQAAILSFSYEGDHTVANCASGIAVGIVAMLLAVYVYFAPQISTIDREHNIFRLVQPEKNKLINMGEDSAEITLGKSKIHGDYVFLADIDGTIADGHIRKTRGLFRRSPLPVKILFIILSEVLVFVWAITYLIYFLRTLDMPNKLKKLMEKNGFEFVPTADEGEMFKTIAFTIDRGGKE